MASGYVAVLVNSLLPNLFEMLALFIDFLKFDPSIQFLNLLLNPLGDHRT